MMKLWKRVALIAAALCLALAAVYLITRPRGTEETVDMTREGYILLADGQKLPCSVSFRGTVYIGSRKVESDQFYPGSDGGIWINDTRILQYYVFSESQSGRPLVISSPEGITYLSKDLSVFVACVDSSLLQLDIPPQTVYVVLKDNTPEQYEPIFEEMERVGDL